MGRANGGLHYLRLEILIPQKKTPLMKTFDSSNQIPAIMVDKRTLLAVRNFIGKHPAERGGMLGSDPDGVIRHFVPDLEAHCTATAYDPNVEAMNRQIKQWKIEGVRFQGFVHSHPPGYRMLSSADKEYAVRILVAFKNLKFLALPLVMTEPDAGEFQLIPFIGLPDSTDRNRVDFLPAPLVVVDGVRQELKTTSNPRDNHRRKRAARRQKPRHNVLFAVRNGDHNGTLHESGRQAVELRYYGRFLSWWRHTASGLTGQESLGRIFPEPTHRDRANEIIAAEADDKLAAAFFQRVTAAYDIQRLDATRLVIIGTGGAAELIRDCARARFGEFILIDCDEVSPPNIATQSANPTDIGLPKADALAKDIVAINPRAAVVAVHGRIEDISDSDFEHLTTGPLRGHHASPSLNGSTAPKNFHYPMKPKNTILLVLTDNFEAQARGHRLGLHFGLPTVCAQEYQEGRGAEITYTVAGATPACHRCITASRYRAYLADGYRNSVTSNGAPIFSAQMLNSALGYVLLAVAHHGTKHPRFGGMVTRLKDRNLILLRMDPDFDAFLGRPTFSRRLAGACQPDAFFMMDALFLKQSPDCGQSEHRPVCPDCGGKGDLQRSVGTFPDTRIMRTQFPKNSVL